MSHPQSSADGRVPEQVPTSNTPAHSSSNCPGARGTTTSSAAVPYLHNNPPSYATLPGVPRGQAGSTNREVTVSTIIPRTEHVSVKIPIHPSHSATARPHMLPRVPFAFGRQPLRIVDVPVTTYKWPFANMKEPFTRVPPIYSNDKGEPKFLPLESPRTRPLPLSYARKFYNWRKQEMPHAQEIRRKHEEHIKALKQSLEENDQKMHALKEERELYKARLRLQKAELKKMQGGIWEMESLIKRTTSVLKEEARYEANYYMGDWERD